MTSVVASLGRVEVDGSATRHPVTDRAHRATRSWLRCGHRGRAIAVVLAGPRWRYFAALVVRNRRSARGTQTAVINTHQKIIDTTGWVSCHEPVEFVP